MKKNARPVEYVGAYLIAGNESERDALLDTLESNGVIERGNPDLFSRVYRKFGVDEAEDLRMRARTRPVAGARRVFVLLAPAMTTESQNALLKTLEEPAADALFFLVTPSPEMLLPTVRSRMQTMSIAAGKDAPDSLLVNVDDFLSAQPQKRIEMLKPLYEHDEDEGRDMGAVLAFLQSLERRFASEKNSPERTAGLHALYRARKFVGDKGSLLKVLLEQVALLTPRLPG